MLYSVDGLRPFQLGILGDYLAWTSVESYQFSLLKLYNTEPVTLNLLTPSSEILPLVGLTIISNGQLTRGNFIAVSVNALLLHVVRVWIETALYTFTHMPYVLSHDHICL